MTDRINYYRGVGHVLAEGHDPKTCTACAYSAGARHRGETFVEPRPEETKRWLLWDCPCESPNPPDECRCPSRDCDCCADAVEENR